MPDHDPPATDPEAEAVVALEDLAVLDIEASVDEVMTVVHWIEDHTGATPNVPEHALAMPGDLAPPEPALSAAPVPNDGPVVGGAGHHV